MLNVTCRRDGQVVFTLVRHDSENEVKVMKQASADCGSYHNSLKYQGDWSRIMSLITVSSLCKQKVRAKCRNVLFLDHNCTWLEDRNGKKLNYWGGLRAGDIGCVCGLSKTCYDSSLSCNCGVKNLSQHATSVIDEGFLTDKGILPVTGIRVGDAKDEGHTLKYTIGPLECLHQSSLPKF